MPFGISPSKNIGESEERFRKFFEQSPAIMYVFDTDTHKLQEANPAAVAFFGWTREELLNKKIGDVCMLNAMELDRAI